MIAVIFENNIVELSILPLLVLVESLSGFVICGNRVQAVRDHMLHLDGQVLLHKVVKSKVLVYLIF